MKNDLQFKDLLRKYDEGTATDAERSLLENWYNVQSSVLGEEVEMEEMDSAKQSIWMGISSDIDPVVITPTFRLWKPIAAAASVILVASIGLYIYRSSAVKQNLDQVAIENHIVPGNNRAVLTLSDGSKIDLTEAKSGDLALQGSVRISKASDGQLVYQFGNAINGESGFNTVSTPIGGQYQVALPDGSKVWLNAASSLKFPVSFTSPTERKVELTGEAYFEVAKDKLHPFLVSSSGQTVEVLGTHFDVNAYGDAGVKTTLLEGSVKVSAGNKNIKLVPGQQSRLASGALSMSSVDAEDAVAWKNGYFSFASEDLETIMKSVSRWYDVEVVYNDEEVKKFTFWGTVSRFAKVGDVLRVLERTEKIHFRIEGKKIIVSK